MNLLKIMCLWAVIAIPITLVFTLLVTFAIGDVAPELAYLINFAGGMGIGSVTMQYCMNRWL